MKRKKNKLKQKGFTLIELIIVLVIIGILSAILAPSVVNYITTYKDKSAIAEAQQVVQAARSYAAEQYATNRLNLPSNDLQVTGKTSEGKESVPVYQKILNLAEVNGTIKGDIISKKGDVEELLYRTKENIWVRYCKDYQDKGLSDAYTVSDTEPENGPVISTIESPSESESETLPGSGNGTIINIDTTNSGTDIDNSSHSFFEGWESCFIAKDDYTIYYRYKIFELSKKNYILAFAYTDPEGKDYSSAVKTDIIAKKTNISNSDIFSVNECTHNNPYTENKNNPPVKDYNPQHLYGSCTHGIMKKIFKELNQTENEKGLIKAITYDWTMNEIVGVYTT